MMCDAYKKKNGDCYKGELSDGMRSGKSTVVPVHQLHYLPAFFSSNRFPQAYTLVVPLPCYLPSFTSPDDSGSNGSNMKGTAFYKELESLLDEPTMPSWEEFVSGLDAQAPTMPSWEEFASDFEERAYRDIELEAMAITKEPWERSRSDLESNAKGLAENKTELETKDIMAESLSDLESNDIDFEVNAKDPEENKTEQKTKPKEMDSMTMPSLASSQLEDTSLEGSKRSWSKEEEPSIEDRQQIDAYTKEPDEIVQSNNEESPSAIKQGGSCSGRFGRCANLVVQGGRCLKCTRRYTCGHDNCANYPVKGGLCVRHGAKMPTCSHEGCINNAKKGGLCLRHGAKLKTCVYEGCTNIARRKGGVCWSHNATEFILY